VVVISPVGRIAVDVAIAFIIDLKNIPIPSITVCIKLLILNLVVCLRNNYHRWLL
jgi:hypothetical protein